MKKILCVILSLAIVTSCVAMLTFTANAATKLTVDFEGVNPFTAPVTGTVEVVDGGKSGKCLKFTGAGNSWGAPFLTPEATKSVIKAAGKYTVEFDIKMDTQPGKGFSIILRGTGMGADKNLSNRSLATVAESKTYKTGEWIHVTKTITIQETDLVDDLKLGFDSFDHDGGARYIDNYTLYVGAPKFYAAAFDLSTAAYYNITQPGIFAGIDFGSATTKEVTFAAYLDGEASTALNQFQVAYNWGTSFYTENFDDKAFNDMSYNTAWNKLFPSDEKTVTEYTEPKAMEGNTFTFEDGLAAGNGVKFSVVVPKKCFVVYKQTRYLKPDKTDTDQKPASGEEGKDFATYVKVTSVDEIDSANLAIRVNTKATPKAANTLYVYCISDEIVNSNMGNAAVYQQFAGIKGFATKEDAKAACAAFVALIDTPAPTAAPTTPPDFPYIHYDEVTAYEIDATKLTLGQLVKAKAGITTLPDGNNTVKYTVYNPNDFDIVVSLMMQTGKNGEGACTNDGWNFIVDDEGKPLSEKYVTVKAGKSADLTFTFPVKDNKVVCNYCDNAHDVSTLYVRFDCCTAEKEGETSYKKMTTGSFFVLTTGDATLDGYLSKLAAANSSIITEKTIWIPRTFGEITDTLSWYIDDEKTLHLTGTGDMPDFDSEENLPPWTYLPFDKIVIEEGVTRVGDYAFSFCYDLTEVELAATVSSIGDFAFAECTALKKIGIPASVTDFGDSVFAYCENPLICCASGSAAAVYAREHGLTSIFIAGKCGYGVNYSFDENTGTLYISGTGEMADYSSEYDTPWYSYRWPVRSVIIENGVTRIGAHAFEDCRYLTSITIPNSVTNIGDYAFMNCTDLTSITIPESVTSIGDYAFAYCNKLISVVIPSSVADIGANAFASCLGLNMVTLCNGVKNIESKAFYNCANLTSARIPGSVTYIASDAFYISYDVTFSFCNTSSYAARFAADNGIPTEIIDHVPGETATCTEDQTCTACGQILVSKHHQYIDDACIICGALRSEPTATPAPTSTAAPTPTPTITTPSPDEPQITVSSKRGKTGTEITVDVGVKNNPGFMALSFAIQYDSEKMTLTDVENKIDGFSLTKGVAIVLDGSENFTADGTILTLTFAINEDAEPGDVLVYPIAIDATNDDLQPVSLAAGVGTVTIIDYLYGDANGDGIINTLDLAMLRKYLAAKDPMTGISSIEAEPGIDANGDGTVSTLDLAMLRKYLANKDPITGESSVVLGPKA